MVFVIVAQTRECKLLISIDTENLSVYGESKVGGIVGSAGQYSEINNCSVSAGNVSTVPNHQNHYVGGIAGYLDISANNRCITIENCLNKGEIAYAASDSPYGCGIVYVASNSKYYVSVTNCINVGKVNTAQAKYMISSESYEDCYWDSFVNSGTDSDISTGKTTDEIVNRINTFNQRQYHNK